MHLTTATATASATAGTQSTEPGPKRRRSFSPNVEERVAIDRVLVRCRRRWRGRRAFARDPRGHVVALLDSLGPPSLRSDPDRHHELVNHVLELAWDAHQSELWEVENRSRWKIVLREEADQDGDGLPDDLVLAPLERRISNVHPRHLYPIRLLVRHQFLGVRPYRPSGNGLWKFMATAAALLPLILGLAALLWGDWFRSTTALIGTAALAGAAGALAGFGAWKSAQRDYLVPDGGPSDPGAYRDSFATPPLSSDAGLWLAERAAYLLMFAVTVLGPALALYLGTDLSQYLRFSPRGMEVLTTAQGGRATAQQEIVGRSLQLVYCSVVSMLPALLYFTFDRQKLSSQRESWIRHLFHLNPHIWTVSEIEAAYGSRLDEALGGGGIGGRLVGGRRMPIVVATILFTLGWTLLLLDTEVRGFPRTDTAKPYLDLLMPSPTVAGMAFLGSYFFALQFILRSFIRGDLRPKSYSTIAARVVAGVTVAYLVGIVFDAPTAKILLLVAFLAGYVPDTVLRRVANLAKDLGPSVGREMDGNELDLRVISGMDIYAKTKLISEGITNVEALAHTDPIDLLARTRFPAAELIDWIDQAVLLIHLPRCAQAGARKGRRRGRAKTGVEKDLACVGIRTATNILNLCEECGQEDFVSERIPGGRPVLTAVLQNLKQESVLVNLRAWRASTQVGLGQEVPGFLREHAVGPDGQDWDQPYVDKVAIRSVQRQFDLRHRWIEHSGGPSGPQPLG